MCSLDENKCEENKKDNNMNDARRDKYNAVKVKENTKCNKIKRR